jgi:hypothetical protein
VKDKGDGLPRKAPRHYVRTDLVPSSMVYRLLLAHECVPAGDVTPRMPQSTFIENDTAGEVIVAGASTQTHRVFNGLPNMHRVYFRLRQQYREWRRPNFVYASADFS